METALQQALKSITEIDAAEYHKRPINLQKDIMNILISLIPAEQEQHEGKFEEGYKQACVDNLIEPDDDVLIEHIKDLRQTYQSK